MSNILFAWEFGGGLGHVGPVRAIGGELVRRGHHVALAALVVDLRQRGMLDETIVVCSGEFGRTPVVNRTAGRDHWSRAMSYLLAGGGFQEGLVYGETDSRGFDPVADSCSPDDLAATLLSQLGFPPEHKVQTMSGRPVALFENGDVIDRIVA